VYNAGFFEDKEDAFECTETCATSEDMDRISKWEHLLKTITQNMARENGLLNLSMPEESEPEIYQGMQMETETEPSTSKVTSSSTEHRRPKLALLNDEQRRAHDIVEEKLLQELSGKCVCARCL